MLSLSQKLSQQQKLSPQQIQYQKLLQLNTLALEQRIKNELEINPVLEESMDEEMEMREEKPDKDNSSSDDTSPADEEENSEEAAIDDEFGVEDYMNDEEMDNSEKLNKSNDDDYYQPLAPAKESLSEHLLNQLRLLDLDDDMYMLGEEIIGNLDDDGYLKRELSDIVDELNTFESVQLDPGKAELLLKKIQKFDPIGIACRTLKECLLVQLKTLKLDPYYSYLAEEVLVNHYDDFTKKRYDSIKLKMNLTDSSLKATIELIQSLNPKPGEGNADLIELNQITPDFIIEKVENNFIITLNDKSLPSVTISRDYLELFKEKKKDKKEKNTYKFLKEKFESAKWFIACIQQRRETLMKIMQAILEKQYEFFEMGPKYLHPMIYKDIAEEINMDISTISRVVNGKYVQSPMGIFELKYFFSEGLATDTGEEVSNKHIKERLKELMEKEDKKSPLSDDRLAEILNEEGIHIARRTVAKYREQLRLPIARLRKEL